MLLLKRLPPPARATPSDPPSHRPSAATSAVARRPPAPCTPASFDSGSRATRPLADIVFLPGVLRRAPLPCSTPPAASPHRHRPALPRPTPANLDALAAAPRSSPLR